MILMIEKKRCIIILSLILALLMNLFFLTSCTQYNTEWIIGKTSSEIEKRYGIFDQAPTSPEFQKDGNYISCRCGYTTKEEHVGFLGTDPTEYFVIYFDSEGKAYKVIEDWVVPGG